MTDAPTELTPQDRDHLRWLSLGHYVTAGLTTLCGFFPVIHLVLGIAMASGEMNEGPNPPPPAMGYLFIGVAIAIMAMFWGTAVLFVVAGRNLRACRRRTLCFVAAIVGGVFFQPVGLVLGILTVLVLMRPSVAAAFQRNAQGAGAPAPAQF